jgi:hypothetical protein
MHADDLLAELAHALQLPTLKLSAWGTASLVVDGELAIDLEHDADAARLVASIALGAPPAAEREALYAKLLAANLYGHGSGGGAVALDTTRGELLLHRAFALEGTDAAALESALAELVAAARELRGEWSAAPAPAAAAAVDPRAAAMLRA